MIFFPDKKENKKIYFLAVDDSRVILATIKHVISIIMSNNEYDYELDTFQDVSSFLKNRKDIYDIAIVDWNLPDGNGDDVISILQKDNKTNTKSALYSGIDTTLDISLYTGMTDDSQTLCEYSIEKKITYIPKGDKDFTIIDYIKKTVDNLIQND